MLTIIFLLCRAWVAAQTPKHASVVQTLCFIGSASTAPEVGALHLAASHCRLLWKAGRSSNLSSLPQPKSAIYISSVQTIRVLCTQSTLTWPVTHARCTRLAPPRPTSAITVLAVRLVPSNPERRLIASCGIFAPFAQLAKCAQKRRLLRAARTVQSASTP